MLNILIDNGENKYNAITDLHCYPKSFSIGVAEPKTNYVEVPYRNGDLDMSEAISPIRYRDRIIKVPLIIVHDSPLFIYDLVSNAFSGRVCKVRLLDKYDGYDDYYYEGRVTIDKLYTVANGWEFEFSMVAHPYKMREVVLKEKAPVTLEFYNSGIDVVPIVTVDAFASGTWNGKSFSLAVGTHQPVDLKILHGNNVISITGSANVEIDYLNKRL